RWLDIDFTAGINGMYQDNKSKDATDFPIPDYHSIDGGAYLYARHKHGPFTFSGGIRYDLRHLSIPDQTHPTSTLPGAPPTGPNTPANQKFPSLEKTFTGLSSSLGATYNLTSTLTLKANISSGYRSPNITEIASNGLDPGAHIIYLGNRNFVPELSWQQDLGLEYHQAALDLNLTLFNNHIQHYIYLSQLADAQGNPVTDAQGNKTFQYEQASAQLYGLEATASLHPETLKGFSLESAFAFVQGTNKKKEYAHTGTQGEYLPFIPPMRWTTNLEQSLKISPTLTLTAKAGFEYNAAQNRYLALYNTETATPAYTLLHIGAGADIRCSSSLVIQWQVQVDNLLNTACQSNLSRLKYFEYYSHSPNGHTGIYNMGRSINTRITIPF
ncbi:MAG: TonB-dependent receptor, partial [Bacteroidetes bacterium]|nr:TonB-dependent receptor [Bacteroidota bacterium]